MLRRPRVLLTAILAVGLTGAAFAGFYNLWAAPLNGPQASDRQITIIVTSLMRREHISKKPLDDTISARGLKEFIKTLDPAKVYFTQQDVDEFSKSKNNIDDMLKRGDITLAHDIFKRFLQRVDERIAMVDQLLQMPQNHADDEDLITDRDLLTFPKTAAEAQNRWRKRIEYDFLAMKADKTEGKEAVEKLRRRYRSFAKRMHQFDNNELLEMYLTAITTSYDPHTSYMSPTSYENFLINMRLELEGIGAALRSTDGETIVTKIIPGGAAAKNGKLKPEDEVVSVGEGEDGEMVDVVDMKLNDVVARIRGRAGTVVRLGVKRKSGASETVRIVRAKIELKDSEARGVIFEEGRHPNGKPVKIGVIDLPSFYMDMKGARAGLADYKSTTRDCRRILADFKSKGVDVVLLDLTRNGGGSLNEAISLTGLFIDRGPVVQVKDSAGTVQQYDDLEAGMAWDGPLVVLTSKFSASASEILAGAIQDYRRGIVVGDTATHGKGTVQSLMDLGQHMFRIRNPPNMGALKITMQQFYRPDGDSTQKRGVVADLPLPSLTNHMDVGESDLDFALEFDRVPTAKHVKYNMVRPDILNQLVTNSLNRRKASQDFASLQKKIAKYREQKERKAISLNEEKFFARRQELNAEKEEEKEFDNQQNGEEEIIKRDFYYNEVLAIAAEYTVGLERAKIAATAN